MTEPPRSSRPSSSTRSSTRAAPPAQARCWRRRRGLGTVRPGSIVEIWSTDPVTKTDIGAWSAKVGHQFLGAIAADGYDRVFVKRLK